MSLDVGVGSSLRELSASQFNPTHSVAEELYSLLDEVDSESIAEGFEIGIHSMKHDFDNHLKIAIFERLDPSDSLAELAEKTATHDQLSYMVGSTFSRRTNDRDYRAVVRVLFELLRTPQLYHQRAVQRKRLDWLNRAVVALTQQISASPDQLPLPVNSTKTQLFTNSSQPTVDSNSTSLRAQTESTIIRSV